jgi:hypothetical protein
MDTRRDASTVTVAVVFFLLFALLFAALQYYEEHGHLPTLTKTR